MISLKGDIMFRKHYLLARELSNNLNTEKSFKVAFLALLLEKELDEKVDFEKVLKMIIVKSLTIESEDNIEVLREFFQQNDSSEQSSKSILKNLKELTINESFESQIVNSLYNLNADENMDLNKIFPKEEEESSIKEDVKKELLNISSYLHRIADELNIDLKKDKKKDKKKKKKHKK